MAKYIIKGGNRLEGEITISGAKNAAVAIIPAAILVNGICTIENIPKISDVTLMLEILAELGAKVNLIDDTTISIDASNVRNEIAPYELVRVIRASYYLLGAQVGRFGVATVALPGGCNFGVRPIDQHIKGLEALGSTVKIQNGLIIASAQEPLKGNAIYLDTVSVGATINIMIAACLADGMTTIENAAKEPHIVDVANFLNAMGANVSGAGTDVIKVRGVKEMTGGHYSIIPDQIEAGTYMAAIAATGGEVLIKNVIPKHLESISAKLEEMGVEIKEFDESVLVRRNARLKKTSVKTMPYPGFPTDMQPQIAVLMAIADGTSTLTEGVWDANRFRYIEQLLRMGAKAQVDGKIAVIEGVSKLTGAKVESCDLRAGAAMVIAGLVADGITELSDVIYIERGYENIIEKLRAVGADIRRIEDDFAPKLRVAL